MATWASEPPLRSLRTTKLCGTLWRDVSTPDSSKAIRTLGHVHLEGIAKLTGSEQYLDALIIEGCLWGMTVRSSSPRGKIEPVTFDPSIDWKGGGVCLIVDQRNIPGANQTYLIGNDQPVLAGGVGNMLVIDTKRWP